MITIEKADDFRRCQCCHSDESVREISFSSDHVGTVVALCAKCRRELERALYIDSREFFSAWLGENGFCSLGERSGKKDDVQK